MAKLRGHIGYVVTALALAVYAATGIYQVQTDESGVAFCFGRVVGRDLLPGIHWNAPWPMGRVVVAKTATNFIMPIGYRLQPRPGLGAISDMWLTGDTNVITARLIIQYRIKSLTGFVVAHEAPREMVRRAGERVLADFLAREGVDGVLTTRRNVIPKAVTDGVQKLLDELQVGIEVQSVSIQELAPPLQGGVRDEFQDVQNAKSDRERLVHEARASAAQTLAEAQGEADRIHNQALADKRRSTERAKGRGIRFAALAAQHDAAPKLTEERLFLETVERVLGKTQNFVVEPNENGSVKLRVLQ